MKNLIFALIAAICLSSCAAGRCGIDGKKFGEKHCFKPHKAKKAKKAKAYIYYSHY